MRRLLALFLLAGSAAPGLAAADPGDFIRSHSNREGKQEARSETRSERSGANRHVVHENRSGGDSGERQFVRANRSGEDSGDRQFVRANRSGGDSGQQQSVQTRSADGGSSGVHRSGSSLRARFGGGEPPAIQPSGDESKPSDSVRSRRSEEPRRLSRGPKIIEPTVFEAPTLRQSDQPLPRVFRNRVPMISDTPREGTQPPLRAERRRTDRVNWSSSHWRNDKRYDWRDWRRRHRSLFRLGFYYDPFGWNYRPYSIGWRMWPSYFSSRYWLSDPWMYRLPYAPPGYRWIRYYDDALLVDTWSGRVVDVIYNFFW